jgi:hypothetical protein
MAVGAPDEIFILAGMKFPPPPPDDGVTVIVHEIIPLAHTEN